MGFGGVGDDFGGEEFHLLFLNIDFVIVKRHTKSHLNKIKRLFGYINVERLKPHRYSLFAYSRLSNRKFQKVLSNQTPFSTPPPTF